MVIVLRMKSHRLLIHRTVQSAAMRGSPAILSFVMVLGAGGVVDIKDS